jgi:aminoglycoside phosphotransferase (APT) family kinase protein
MESAILADEHHELSTALDSFLREQTGRTRLHVVGLHRIGGGSSRENWPFDLVLGTGPHQERQELLVRRDPAETVVDSDRATEFNLLKALGSTSIPAPGVLWLDETGKSFGRPSMIMRRHPGHASRALLREKDPMGLGLARRTELGRELCSLMAALQAVDLNTTGLSEVMPAPDGNPAAVELATWVDELNRQEADPEPRLRMTATWLRENLPAPPARLVLVHGDFRPANVLIHDGRIEALLDWELARLGDPLDDIGWYTTPLYRQEHFIPGHWEVEEFLSHYEEESGHEVDRQALRFWQVLAMFRLAVMALTSMRSFQQGLSDRPSAPIDSLAARTLAAAVGP